MQAVQAEIGLGVQSPVRDHPGDDVKIKAVIRQVELQEALGLVGGVVSGSDSGLSGRQIALKPGPLQLPVKNASGPNCNAVVSGPCWNRGGTG
jgi:hypothetical protein